MARAARKALADMRALEWQAERMNIVDPRKVTVEELLGRGATPSMGLSQVRGGADCALDEEECHDVDGTFFDGECYNAPAEACSGKPPMPGKKCAYPEWESRSTSNAYKAGDRVMYDGLPYEALRTTTVQPIRQPPDPNAYTPSPYWNEVDCDKFTGGAECVLDAEDCHDVNGTFFEGECYDAPAEACSGKPPAPGEKCAYPEWESRSTSNAYKAGDRVMYKGMSYEALRSTTVQPIRQPPDPNAGSLSPYWKEVACESFGSGRMVGGLAERSGNTMMSGTYRGLGAGSPAAMAMADVKSLKGGAGKSWFDGFIDGLIEKATKKVGELAQQAFNEYFDKLIEYGWNYAKEHGVNWIRENVFGDKVARGVEKKLEEQHAEVENARKREHSAPAHSSMADRKAAAAAAADRTAAAKKAYEESRDKKRGAGEANDLEGGYGNYGAYVGGHCPDGEHLRMEVSGKGKESHHETPSEYAENVLEHPEKHTTTTRKRAQFLENVKPSGGKKRRAAPSAGDGRRKRADIVKKVMAEKGLKMIEASKYVKQHNLY